ncbi:MAG TPA: glycine zipper 2TM domain-containing protein [Caulobacteraceae bacterium]|nr:glycine zipper 2TM domain-containing protein [Caulobacteraceae bacterium]
MNRSIRMRHLALGMAALLTAAAPAAMAVAQSYGQGGGYDERRAYEQQYGPGSYDRYMDYQRNHPNQHYSQSDYDNQRRDYDSRYGAGAASRYDNRQARAACHDEKKGNELAGGLLGGIFGAVVGSNVARGGGREGGAIIGAGAGALAGSQIAKSQTNC